MAHDTLKSFLREPRSINARLAMGKAYRQKMPRKTLGDYQINRGRLDAVTIIARQTESRFPDLIPIRHARMAVDPFAFFRGGAAIMAQDLASLPSPAISVQLCGDMHVSNFGFFSTTERRLVFGINDFDETLPGNFDWDLKRLAASAMIAAHALGQDDVFGEHIVRRMSVKYRQYLGRYAATPYIELARSYIDDERILHRAKTTGATDAACRYVESQISK